ncbi:unnamed protein product [Heterosigma akashiwo]
MSRRLEIIRTPCKWSPHLWHVRQLLLSAGIRLDWSFERCVQNHEVDYPPLRVEVRVVLGTRDSGAEDEVLRRVWHIFTDWSKRDEGVWVAFAVVNGQGCWQRAFFGCRHGPRSSRRRWLPSGRPWSGARTIGRREVGSSPRTRALCYIQCAEPAQAHPITAEVVRLAGDYHSLVYVPEHQGIPRNEEADRPANLAVTNGIYAPVDVPRAHTRRLAGDYFWGQWEREWGSAGSAYPDSVQALRPEPGSAARQCVGQGPGGSGSAAPVWPLQPWVLYTSTGSTWRRLKNVSCVMRTRLWSTTCCGVRGGLVFRRRRLATSLTGAALRPAFRTY